MKKYRLVAKKGEGTFSEVLKAQNIKTGKYAAIKCMKSKFESLDQVNNLREIQALRRLSPHPHVIKLEEVLYDQPSGRLALVFELMEMNMYDLIKNRNDYLEADLVRIYMYQAFKALAHMHRKGIFHRDIKPENILLGPNQILVKLADFGSCRGIYSKQPYTEYISTRWYRGPECLMTNGYYGPEMDVWGLGCVMFEIVSLYPLFPGQNEADQIDKIHRIMGTPSQEMLSPFRKNGASHIDFENLTTYVGTPIAKLLANAPKDASDLVAKLLKYNPKDRLTADQALAHDYFKSVRDIDVSTLTVESISEKIKEHRMNPQSSQTGAGSSNSNQAATSSADKTATEDGEESHNRGGGSSHKKRKHRDKRKSKADDGDEAEKPNNHQTSTAAESDPASKEGKDLFEDSSSHPQQDEKKSSKKNSNSKQQPSGMPAVGAQQQPSPSSHQQQQQQYQMLPSINSGKSLFGNNNNDPSANTKSKKSNPLDGAVTALMSTMQEGFRKKTTSYADPMQSYTKVDKQNAKRELPQLTGATSTSTSAYSNLAVTSTLSTTTKISPTHLRDPMVKTKKVYKTKAYYGRNGQVVGSRVYDHLGSKSQASPPHQKEGFLPMHVQGSSSPTKSAAYKYLHPSP